MTLSVIGLADPPDMDAVHSSIAAAPLQSCSNNGSCSTLLFLVAAGVPGMPLVMAVNRRGKVDHAANVALHPDSRCMAAARIDVEVARSAPRPSAAALCRDRQDQRSAPAAVDGARARR